MRAILKQTSWLVLAQILTRGIGFFYTIFLARNLGVEDFGLFTVALAYFSIISSIADFGFNRFLIREVAREEFETKELLCNVAMLRLTLTALLFGIFATALYSLDPDKMRVSLILLSTLAILPQSIALTFDSIFVGLRKLQFSATALILASALTTLAGVLLVTYGFGVFGVVNALIFGQVIYAATLIILLFSHLGLLLSNIKLSIIKKAIVESLPYGLLGVLGLLYFRIDVVILSYLKGSFETGIYGVAYRFLEAVVFIPSSFALAILPISIKKIAVNPQSIYKLYKKAMSLLFLIAIPLTFAYWFVLPFFIRQFLPQYFKSINVLLILALTIPFMFMISVQGAILFSSKKFLKALLIMSVFNLSFNVLMNLYLIPNYSYFGAAWATLISDIVGFCLFFVYIRAKFLNLK